MLKALIILDISVKGPWNRCKKKQKLWGDSFLPICLLFFFLHYIQYFSHLDWQQKQRLLTGEQCQENRLLYLRGVYANRWHWCQGTALHSRCCSEIDEWDGVMAKSDNMCQCPCMFLGVHSGAWLRPCWSKEVSGPWWQSGAGQWGQGGAVSRHPQCQREAHCLESVSGFQGKSVW